MSIIGSNLAGLHRTAGQQQAVPSAVYTAVAEASERTGVDFSYLMTQARTESNFNAEARSKSSSATGLYQFIERTWLDMVDRHGEAYGLGEYADKISRRADGSYEVEGGYQVRKEILSLRRDVELSAFMAAEYAGENADFLRRRLGREVSDTDLYLAHFLGAGGASQFLSKMDENGQASAADALPWAARANRPIFYHKDGSEKSLNEVYAAFDKRFSDQLTYYAMGDSSAPHVGKTESLADAGSSSMPPLPPARPDSLFNNRVALSSEEGASVQSASRSNRSTQATPGAIEGSAFYAMSSGAPSGFNPAGVGLRESVSSVAPLSNAPFMASYLMAALDNSDALDAPFIHEKAQARAERREREEETSAQQEGAAIAERRRLDFLFQNAPQDSTTSRNLLDGLFA